MIGHYVEYRAYSITHGQEMSRISMFDAHGQEFFATIPAGEGKMYREQRQAACERLIDAMDAGYPPGEVHLT